MTPEQEQRKRTELDYRTAKAQGALASVIEEHDQQVTAAQATNQGSDVDPNVFGDAK
ncbi:hypothetical protein pEaSNUABM29_00164 [Erwinia phage pEa_SNUABM_29]|nr:hypothetical protein pEaSNUABM29_00164 [Erwinia phage pEa_SNUABM_29]